MITSSIPAAIVGISYSKKIEIVRIHSITLAKAPVSIDSYFFAFGKCFDSKQITRAFHTSFPSNRDYLWRCNLYIEQVQ